MGGTEALIAAGAIGGGGHLLGGLLQKKGADQAAVRQERLGREAAGIIGQSLFGPGAPKQGAGQVPSIGMPRIASPQAQPPPVQARPQQPPAQPGLASLNQMALNGQLPNQPPPMALGQGGGGGLNVPPGMNQIAYINALKMAGLI